MSDLKNELSEKSRYYIPKHRYLELKHYCLQYPEWVQQYSDLEPRTTSSSTIIFGHEPSKPTENLAVKRSRYASDIELVRRVTRESDESISHYILLSVTRGLSYNTLRTVYDIPCGRDYFYDRYRRFFWLLSWYKLND